MSSNDLDLTLGMRKRPEGKPAGQEYRANAGMKNRPR